MNYRLIPFAAFALLGALADEAPAQPRPGPDATQPIGTCVVILTDVVTTETLSMTASTATRAPCTPVRCPTQKFAAATDGWRAF